MTLEQLAEADESNPTFCKMVNAMRDEYLRLKGFAPYTADLISMLRAALRSAYSEGAKP